MPNNEERSGLRFPRITGRGLILVLVAGLVLVACGGDDDDATDDTVDPGGVDVTETSGADVAGSSGVDATEPSAGGAGGLIQGECPIDAAVVGAAVGRELPEDPESPCRFSDGVTVVTVHVQGAGGAAFHDSYKQDAEARLGHAADFPRGDLGLLAVGEAEAQVIVDVGDAALWVNVLGLELDATSWETMALELVDASLD